MSIHLDGLNPDARDGLIQFPADVNGKRICCVIDRTVIERLNSTAADRDADPVTLFKQNWLKIRDVAYFKLQREKSTPEADARVTLHAADFEEGRANGKTWDKIDGVDF